MSNHKKRLLVSSKVAMFTNKAEPSLPDGLAVAPTRGPLKDTGGTTNGKKVCSIWGENPGKPWHTMVLTSESSGFPEFSCKYLWSFKKRNHNTRPVKSLVSARLGDFSSKTPAVCTSKEDKPRKRQTELLRLGSESSYKLTPPLKPTTTPCQKYQKTLPQHTSLWASIQ